MIQHILDGVEVFSQKDTSIKVTKENPILTDSSSYTMDVNFPLNIEANKKFFGALNRIEVSKKEKTYDVKMLQNGVPLLVGTARLTKVNEDCVTLQYVAGNSNVRFWNDADEQYIDEYDYNTMEDGNDIVKKYMYGGYGQAYEKDVEYNADEEDGKVYFTYYEDSFIFDKDGKDFNYFRGQQGIFTFAKVYDTSHSDKEQKIPAFGNGEKLASLGDGRENTMRCFCNCIQPNLLWIVKQICSKRGYTLDFGTLKDTPAENIYIASARQTLKMADALPHWTVKEFMDEFQNLFNVTIVFDDVKFEAVIRGNESIINESIREITGIADEREITVNEEEIETLDNVMYDKWDDSYVVLAPDEVREKNHIQLDTDELSKIYYYMNQTDVVERRDSVFVSKSGHRYLWNPKATIYLQEPVLFDFMGPVDTDYDNATKLKIRPAKVVAREYRDTYWEKRQNHPSNKNLDQLTVYEYWHSECALEMENSWGGYEGTEKSLYEKLEADEEIENRSKEDEMQIFLLSGAGDGCRKQDKLTFHIYGVVKGTRTIKEDKGEVAFTDDAAIKRVLGESWMFWSLPVTEPFTDMKYLALDGYTGRIDASLCMKPDRASWYVGQRFEKKVGYETLVIHQYRFLSHSIPDVRAKFLIRGKMFACQKIEYDIEDDKINPLMTGYFVEIKG